MYIAFKYMRNMLWGNSELTVWLTFVSSLLYTISHDFWCICTELKYFHVSIFSDWKGYNFFQILLYGYLPVIYKSLFPWSLIEWLQFWYFFEWFCGPYKKASLQWYFETTVIFMECYDDWLTIIPPDLLLSGCSFGR